MRRLFLICLAATVLSACSEAPKQDTSTPAEAAVVSEINPLEPKNKNAYVEAAARAVEEAQTQREQDLAAITSTTPSKTQAPAIFRYRLDTTSPDAMANSVNAFAAEATDAEKRDVQVAFFVRTLSLREDLVREVAGGQTPPMDEMSIFVRGYGDLNGLTFAEVLQKTSPLLQRYAAELDEYERKQAAVFPPQG